jgi:hypothetical protein
LRAVRLPEERLRNFADPQVLKTVLAFLQECNQHVQSFSWTVNSFDKVVPNLDVATYRLDGSDSSRQL